LQCLRGSYDVAAGPGGFRKTGRTWGPGVLSLKRAMPMMLLNVSPHVVADLPLHRRRGIAGGRSAYSASCQFVRRARDYQRISKPKLTPCAQKSLRCREDVGWAGPVAMPKAWLVGTRVGFTVRLMRSPGRATSVQ